MTQMVFIWVQGYMSGFNGYSYLVKGRTFDLGSASPEAQWEYIVSFCRSNPNTPIVKAIQEMQLRLLKVLDPMGANLTAPSREAASGRARLSSQVQIMRFATNGNDGSVRSHWQFRKLTTEKTNRTRVFRPAQMSPEGSITQATSPHISCFGSTVLTP